MEGETAIEKSVKDFVFSKIQEKVYLDVSTSNTICIKSCAKQGSIALAMFWLRVLRHQNNYPMPKFPYKDVYDKQGYYKVILKADSVTITTFMRCGTLVMEGSWVLEWFLNTFPAIMEGYDAPIRQPLTNSTVYRQYTENWKRARDADTLRLAEKEAAERLSEDRALEILNDDRSRIISHADKNEDSKKATKSMAEILQQAANAAEKEAEEELELMMLDVWPKDILENQLVHLKTCRVRDGSTYIYPLWKSLLHTWLSDPTRRVYIVTPQLDAVRLVDICNIVLQHRIEANLDSIFVMQTCDQGQTIHQVKNKALSKYDAKDQMYIEYKVYGSIIYPSRRFGASFIACIHGKEAEILTTTACFHGSHFDRSCMDSVHYQKMSDIDFVSKFLAPINASLHDEK
ncbi:uncharacterized protein LOC127872855 isoform X2 [Dreissena polymorpha]|uniref:Uncharacterized protein n=1 Tax=Dreissena polymorpha TaxID=45954 RepID=A0A9D4KSU0_DREPO|nr:uncharacterized protein LOC127872855 isoform X2 [Dreissena polymorpha]KAH3844692.1 hypothetical protein DPMN_086953 [Dreissena polymorpha]